MFLNSERHKLLSRARFRFSELGSNHILILRIVFIAMTKPRGNLKARLHSIIQQHWCLPIWLLVSNDAVIGDQSSLSVNDDGLLVLRGGAVLAPLRVDGAKARPRQ